MCYGALDKQVAGRQRCKLMLASNAVDYHWPTTLHSAKNLVLDLLWPYGKLSLVVWKIITLHGNSRMGHRSLLVG